MRFLTVKPCKGGACDVIPQGSVQVDIDALEQKLAVAGFEVVSNAGRALVVRKGVEATVFDNGRIKVSTESEDVARAMGEEILSQVDARSKAR